MSTTSIAQLIVGGRLDGEYRVALTETSAAMNHHVMGFRAMRAVAA